MEQFKRKIDEHGQPYYETDLPGYMITRMPLLNKSTAFTEEEREELGLTGLIPPHVFGLDNQIERAYKNFKRFDSNLDKHIYLRVLQDRNEVLFYALIDQHLEEMLPIIYTPTVAEAVQNFSMLYRFPRGLVVDTTNIDRIDEVLANLPIQDVRLAVATDSEGILGIGDQGFGGMAICIGKLSLYTAAAGIDPAHALPIELDVGTNRQDLLDDPLYLGVRHKRLVGQEYDDFMETFVTAFQKRFPNALLQWEDFSKQKAFDLLERYKHRLPSFNDDIQGTGAVVLAGILATCRAKHHKITDETFLVYGAGAGGVGVAEQIIAGLVDAGMEREDAIARVFITDSRGLLVDSRTDLDAYKVPYAQQAANIDGWEYEGANPDALDVIRNAGVTALIGLSGQADSFTREIVEAVYANTNSPMIFPLSNPTSNTEAVPKDIAAWTDGRAYIATGSPFPDLMHNGMKYVIGQGNNAFIFPGLGLAALLSRAKEITPGMLVAAAEALANYVPADRLALKGVYPRVEMLRRASKQVAIAVFERAIADGVAQYNPEADGKTVEEFVKSEMWEPVYLPIRRPS